jgi:FixJ family two-component response regulator
MNAHTDVVGQFVPWPGVNGILGVTAPVEHLARGSMPGAARPVSDRDRMAPLVYVVADDDRGRRSLEQLMRVRGFDVEGCRSADDLWERPRPSVPCCLLLDVTVPDARALELQRTVEAAMDVPVVFITGRPDVRITVKAMRAGAVDVLTGPVDEDELLGAVDAALALSRAALSRRVALQSLRDRYGSLTLRERQVMSLVVEGLLNKQAAFELGISEITVKAHRGQVMRKMEAGSLPHLVRMAADLGLPASASASRERSVA